VEPKTATSVLFVCADNAGVSIVAESILRSLAGIRFKPFSAGIAPAPAVGRKVLDFLTTRRLPTDSLRPKSLSAFQASRLDFVITLCPAAEQSLPEDWLGDPVVAHWGIEDEDLWDAFWVLQRRIKIFTSLPHGSAPRHSIGRRVQAMPVWQ
jgi:protein-tyrosine-phosphatase